MVTRSSQRYHLAHPDEPYDEEEVSEEDKYDKPVHEIKFSRTLREGPRRGPTGSTTSLPRSGGMFGYPSTPSPHPSKTLTVAKSSARARARATTSRSSQRSKRTVEQLKSLEKNVQLVQQHILERTKEIQVQKAEAGYREQWMADEMFDTISKTTQRLFSRDGIHPEEQSLRALRLWFWDLVKPALTHFKHLYIELVVGDLRGLWVNITTFNQLDSRGTYTKLVKKLVLLVKTKHMGFNPWLRKLENIFMSMVMCRRALDNADKKMHMLDLVINDPRYTNEVHECADDDELDYLESARRLRHRATRLGNLTNATTKRETHNTEAKTTPEANNSEPGGKGKGKGKGKGRGRGKGGGKGRGKWGWQGKGGQRPPGGAPLSKEDEATKQKLKDQVCERFLFGKCPWGADCWRKHLDMAKVETAQANLTETPPKKKSRKKSTSGEPAPCFSWNKYGSCKRTKCNFSHSGTKGTKTRPQSSDEDDESP